MSAFKHKLVQKQTQSMSLSYGMKLSLDLLQLNSFQLKEYLEKELQENPMYEVDMPMTNSFVSNDTTWDILDDKKSLQDELMLQLPTSKLNLALVEGILQNCDSNGYSIVSHEEIAKQFRVSIAEVNNTMSCIQACEPYGIGARTLSECLYVQVMHRYPQDTLLKQLVQFHLEDIAKNYIDKLAQKYHVDKEDVRQAIRRIQTLNPRPGAAYDLKHTVFVKPDVQLVQEGDELHIVMPNYFTIMEHDYYKEYNISKEDKAFIKEKKIHGKSILDCLAHRKETLFSIMEVLVRHQKDYIVHKGSLTYLRMIDIAQELAMHETTISRAMKDKYYEFEGVVLPMRYLLCKQLNSTPVDCVMATLRKLIDEEQAHTPLSDQKLCDVLKEKQIHCSRRTVAKYREQLHIPSASTRKRLKEKTQ